MNGDGMIDIADAIYLLGYLFANGPAPGAIACDSCCRPVCPSEGLPATGQIACYGYVGEQDWVEVPCGSAEYPGQDGFCQAGCGSAGRFTDNGDGTVTDHCTGLMWQKETAPGEYTWQEALEYCENLSLAGHRNWRLPNVRELESIVDYGRHFPSIDPIFGAVLSDYWSSTNSEEPLWAWLVNFIHGYVYWTVKADGFSVRAVRLGPVCAFEGLPATGQTACHDSAGAPISCESVEWPGQDGFYQAGCPRAGRFTDNGDGTVTDNCTGLMWQKETAPGEYTWQEALEYCENLSLARHDDWRLPNVRELQSIVDYGRHRPSIDPIFGAEPWSSYWSSSTSFYNPAYAWGVGFYSGHMGSDDKTVGLSVRAVRSGS